MFWTGWKINFASICSLAIMYMVMIACGTNHKLSRIEKQSMTAALSLAKEQDYIPELDQRTAIQKDTIKVKDDDGTEMLLMRAIKDEGGQMVAHDVIDAAVVSARFRNVAERKGRVDLEFQVTVPKEMMDSKWQLRFFPDMYIMQDSIRLDSVIVTGKDYRKAQLKGYQHYERFLSSIVQDTSRFVNMKQLEIFIQRNMPDLYAFKTDTTKVSDEAFLSVYGVTEREAIEHYTNKIARRLNNWRKSRISKMYRKYIKVPIVTEGLRLDTVLININGDFVYNYIQTINTRPKLRKVDIVLSGAVYEEAKKVYTIPRTDPLTFYISSLSAFVDNTERYQTKVIERRAEANTACYIDFASGSHDINEMLSHNKSEMSRIKDNLRSLVANEKFDLDSIVITASASPEGALKYNEKLARHRAKSISAYYGGWLKHYTDSLDMGKGFMIDEKGEIKREKRSKIQFISTSDGENWSMLNNLVIADTIITASQKENYFKIIKKYKEVDTREGILRHEPYYKYLRERLYPKLRTVKFAFHLHRKGMVKDTIHTTELDTIYMQGVQALRDRNYETALTLLRPYNDYNTAIAYVSLDYNASAMAILESLEKTAQVNYMLAILYSRKGDDQNAVQCYLSSCRQDPTYVHRGNLDPEIAVLIRRYGLNTQKEDEYSL